eukprot:1145263-Pelagomonas_calceolata.AAC.7
MVYVDLTSPHHMVDDDLSHHHIQFCALTADGVKRKKHVENGDVASTPKNHSYLGWQNQVTPLGHSMLTSPHHMVDDDLSHHHTTPHHTASPHQTQPGLCSTWRATSRQPA